MQNIPFIRGLDLPARTVLVHVDDTDGSDVGAQQLGNLVRGWSRLVVVLRKGTTMKKFEYGWEMISMLASLLRNHGGRLMFVFGIVPPADRSEIVPLFAELCLEIVRSLGDAELSGLFLVVRDSTGNLEQYNMPEKVGDCSGSGGCSTSWPRLPQLGERDSVVVNKVVEWTRTHVHATTSAGYGGDHRRALHVLGQQDHTLGVYWPLHAMNDLPSRDAIS